MSIESFMDTTKPCPARVYDFWLGGAHNFPVDREVARLTMKHFPFAIQAINLNRWFVEYTGRTLAKAGISNFLDLGAGLPTEGALHTAVPETAKVLYVDSDPVTVAYSEHILKQELGNPPNVRYIQGRIEDVDPVLDRAKGFFGETATFAVCMIGVTWFLSDDSLRQAFQRLYDESAPGSVLAVSSNRWDPNDPTQQDVKADYERRTSMKLYLREPDELAQLLGPWQSQESGFKFFESYAEADLRTRIVQLDSRGKVGYAGFFQRPA